MKQIMMLVSLFCLTVVPAAQAAVQGKEASYRADGTVLKG